MTRYTSAEQEAIAELAHRSSVSAADIELWLPGRSVRGSRYAIRDYRVAHGIAVPDEWTPERRAGQAMSVAAANAAKIIPPKPRGYSPDEIAWAEANRVVDPEARLILVHHGELA